ncbi:MAG: hypothetical protein HY904_11885 [Deltaproteobacteria bacterium]|nr:hypothetical protein [Deltaproteobacteria bacterium]
MRPFRAVAVLALCFGPLVATAHTKGVTTQVCPLDKKSFSAELDMSGTTFGKRLDLKPLGPTAAPWRIPVCPRCHVVLFKKEFAEQELAPLSALVATAEYQALAERTRRISSSAGRSSTWVGPRTRSRGRTCRPAGSRSRRPRSIARPWKRR